MIPKKLMERFKARLGIDTFDTSKDDVLKILLAEAESYILSYTLRDKKHWLKQFDAVQLQIAAINYGRLGMEGVMSYKEGEVSTAFFGRVSGKEDYPDSVAKALNPYRRIGRR